MPSRPDPARIDAFLATLREELSSPRDPELLNEVRASFRKRFPLSMRSYAAAYLILKAVEEDGGRRRDRSRGKGREGTPSSRNEAAAAGTGSGRAEAGKRGAKDGAGRAAQAPRDGGRGEAVPAEPLAKESRPRYRGEGVTLFFGMGKRQRLYARVLLKILEEEGGLAMEEIGDIRTFDNYTFVDVAPDKADALLAALANLEFRGRPLPSNRAKKRGEPKAGEELQSEAGERADEDFAEASDLRDEGSSAEAEDAPEDEGEAVVDEDAEPEAEPRS